jgi:glycosyltransferase involved in cell wall biosynthesis
MLCPGDLKTGTSGGMGTCIANLTAAMPQVEPSLRIELYDTRGPGRLTASPPYFFAALARIAGHALTGRSQILHAHMAARGSAVRKLTAVALATPLGIPSVIHLHGSGFDAWYRRLSRPARAMVRWGFRRAGRIIALSDHWRRFLVSEAGVPEDRIDVIYNGVPEPATAADRSAAVPHIVFLGHLSERKGVASLLAALALPDMARLEWRATLAGDGNREAFVEMTRRLGITQRVDFPGWVDRAAADRLLASASIFVLPSRAEALPMAILEALAAGVPVVTTPVGSIPEFLSDGISALLVQPDDATGLGRALVRLLRSPDLRAALSAEGRLVFKRNFDIATVTRQVAETYRRLLGSRPP